MSETNDTRTRGEEGASQDSPEYVQQMVDRADAGGDAQQASSGGDQQTDGNQDGNQTGDDGLPRDENGLILGKYKTAADLAQGYSELQKRLGTGDTGSSTGDEGNTADTGGVNLNRQSDEGGDAGSEGDGSGEGEGGSEENNKPSFDFTKYANEFAEKGELSEDTFTELENKGIPREMTQYYIRGIQAEQEARRSAAMEAIGGEEQFKAVRGWAEQNLSDADLQAFNNQLNAATSAEQVAAVYETLNTRYTKANGKPANFVDGDSGGSSVPGFRSKKEMTDAMSDPRYEKDPAYRAEVEKKVENSNIF